MFLSSVCYHASNYIPLLHISNEVFLWCFQDFSRVPFAENASLKSCGMIFLPLQSSWLLDELSMDKRRSRQVMAMASFQQD